MTCTKMAEMFMAMLIMEKYYLIYSLSFPIWQKVEVTKVNKKGQSRLKAYTCSCAILISSKDRIDPETSRQAGNWLALGIFLGYY